jgi:hypothetical protein
MFAEAVTLIPAKRKLSDASSCVTASLPSSPLAKRACAAAASIMELFRRESVEDALNQCLGDIVDPFTSMRSEEAHELHQALYDFVGSDSENHDDDDLLFAFPPAPAGVLPSDELLASLALAPAAAVESVPLASLLAHAQLPLQELPPNLTPGASFGSRSPATPAQQPKPQPLRNAAPALVRSRKDWSEWEDRRIHEAVAELGLRWRAIASRLPGRSDDAVRNRWLRLRATTPPPPRAKKAPSERVRCGWTAQEDAIIGAAVGQIGSRWARIAALLPNKRTEHAIRNRWHRLQTAAADGLCTVAPSDLSLPLAPARSASEGSVGSQLTVEDAVAPLVVCRAYSA